MDDRHRRCSNRQRECVTTMSVGEMRCGPVQIRPSLVHANRSWANVDIGRPGMNGYELAAKMREARPGSQIRLIAVSGCGQGDRCGAQLCSRLRSPPRQAGR